MQRVWGGAGENVFRYRVRRGCYNPHGCGEAGWHTGRSVGIGCEGLTRRPTTGRWAPCLGLNGGKTKFFCLHVSAQGGYIRGFGFGVVSGWLKKV